MSGPDALRDALIEGARTALRRRAGLARRRAADGVTTFEKDFDGVVVTVSSFAPEARIAADMARALETIADEVGAWT